MLINKLGCIILLFALIFPTSCQKKQVAQIPPSVPEKQTINATENRRTTKIWTKSDSRTAEPDFLINKSTIMSDPYKELTSSVDANSQPKLDRFYQDLDDDGVPEVLIEWNAGTGGGNYSIFKIRKDGYLYLGSIFVWSYSTLQTKHYGFHDLMMFSRLWDLDNDTWGTLQIYEFNGIRYEAVKMMDTSFNNAIKEGIFTPDKRSIEDNPEEIATKWTSKDDDKYRRMLADLEKSMFDVRIEINDGLAEGDDEQEKSTVINSGLQIIRDWSCFILGRATQVQFDSLKKENIKIFKKWEWEVVKQEKKENVKVEPKKFVKDPYKMNPAGLLRKYKDINQDGIPELFLSNTYSSSSGGHFEVYQITKEGYLDLDLQILRKHQFLSTSHNGFLDFIEYTPYYAECGKILQFEFDGNFYWVVKKISVAYWELVHNKMINPDPDLKQDFHPFIRDENDNFKLIWTPKDDDKYRRMIK